MHPSSAPPPDPDDALTAQLVAHRPAIDYLMMTGLLMNIFMLFNPFPSVAVTARGVRNDDCRLLHRARATQAHEPGAPLDADHAGAACAEAYRRARRSSCALTATMTVLADIRTAANAGGRRIPCAARTPAASGIATML